MEIGWSSLARSFCCTVWDEIRTCIPKSQITTHFILILWPIFYILLLNFKVSVFNIYISKDLVEKQQFSRVSKKPSDLSTRLLTVVVKRIEISWSWYLYLFRCRLLELRVSTGRYLGVSVSIEEISDLFKSYERWIMNKLELIPSAFAIIVIAFWWHTFSITYLITKHARRITSFSSAFSFIIGLRKLIGWPEIMTSIPKREIINHFILIYD